MRLTEKEKQAIISTVSDMDEKASIYLFGSRVDDSKRGGDIDIAVISEKLQRSDKTSLRLRLYDLIGEQKIDIVLARDSSKPFIKLAKKNGVLLYGS